VTADIPTNASFVPTDRHGRQFHDGEETFWALPSPAEGAGGATITVPGTVKRPPASGEVTLLDLDGLLDGLGERIFVATGSGLDAQLVSETAWSLSAAANFALDCAEHVSANAGSVALASGETLVDAIAAARKWLQDASGAETGLLGRMSRLATLRRLRHQAGEVGDAAFDASFDVVVDADGQDADIFDDPRWTAIAAVRDAVLAAVEAVRHEAFPHLTDASDDASESERREGVQSPPTVVDTPWGAFRSTHTSAVVPAWVAATEAAERARQAVADAGGTAAATERGWQRDRLAQALRGG
jgi:hypothetical protein